MDRTWLMMALFLVLGVVTFVVIMNLLQSNFHSNVQNVLNSPELLILPSPLRYSQVNVPIY